MSTPNDIDIKYNEKSYPLSSANADNLPSKLINAIISAIIITIADPTVLLIQGFLNLIKKD
jgi:hypothetical protein